MIRASKLRFSMRTRRIVTDTCFNCLMILLCLVVIYPVVWALFSSFKTNQQLFSESPLNLIPSPFTTENYTKLTGIYDVQRMVFQWAVSEYSYPASEHADLFHGGIRIGTTGIQGT